MGKYSSARYLPFGNTAVLIEFGDTIDSETNRKVAALSEAIGRSEIQAEETVPTYRSLLVRYDPVKTTYEKLVFQIKDAERSLTETSLETEGQRFTVPVAYGREYGPDLGNIARLHGLTERQVIKIHLSREYRVYMIGFVAGFPYLGEVADKIATPRLETPRLKVPAGSVGIAGTQTGIYPCEAPGGWHILGRTPIRLFNHLQQPPTPLKAGDIVRFKPISHKKFRIMEKPEPRSSAEKLERMNVFRVIKPGLLTTIQDTGRHDYLRYGVPISGAMDTFSLIVANYLVGNDQNDACLETTLIGPELQASVNIQIAITGGNCSPKIDSCDVPMWQTLTVQRGSTLSFGKMESGCRAYIAIKGGINVPLVLGSRSTYLRGGFGGIDGRQLKAGDLIAGFDAQPMMKEYRLPDELIPEFPNLLEAKVILGPQDEMFTEEGLETLLSNPFKVTTEADRMGYRLEGPFIEHRRKADIVSDALLPGAIQVPKSGKPILIMKDAQTTGGYPKIAVVIASDLSDLGQAKPDDRIEFSIISMSQAHEKALQLHKSLDDLKRTVRA